MSNEWYFVINMMETEPRIRRYDRQELIRYLDENSLAEDDVFTEFPRESDLNCWKGKTLIIKGTVAKVTPPGDWRIE